MKIALRRESALLLGLSAVALWTFRQRKSAAGLGVAAAGLWFSTRGHKETFRNQTALITGGSRGLGLALALELVKDGARVSLIARDEAELRRAREILLAKKPNAQVLICPCDVTNESQLRDAMKRTEETLGPIRLLINDAGSILVGPFESTRREDFDAQLELHLHAVIQSVRLILPRFRRQNGGRIINICSMGGKIAVPHMLTYDASKFALAGFSQGIAAELARENITVTTAYPTLMRTGSPIQAVFKGSPEKEFSWFNTFDNIPGLSMEPDTAAKKILKASLERRCEVILSAIGKVRMFAGVLFPELMISTMSLMNRMMPTETSRQMQTGAQSRDRFDRSFLLQPLKYFERQAERRWNQTEKLDARFNAGLTPDSATPGG